MLRRVIRSALFFLFTYRSPAGVAYIPSCNEDTFIGIPGRRTPPTCSTPCHPAKCNYADALNYRSASAIVADGSEQVMRSDAPLFFRFPPRCYGGMIRINPLCASITELVLEKFCEQSDIVAFNILIVSRYIE